MIIGIMQKKRIFRNSCIYKGVNALCVTYGMDIEEHDNEGRIITTKYDSFILVNVYTPNSKRELLRPITE